MDGIVDESLSFAADSTLSTACALSALLPVIVFPVFGKNQRDLARKWFLKVTPPNIWFSVWFVILIAFDAAAVHAWANKLWAPISWICFALVNVNISLWTIIYGKGTVGALIISVVLEAILVLTNQVLWVSLVQNKGLQNEWGILSRNFISFGQGWFVAATSLGVGQILVYYFGVPFKTQILIFWFVTPLAYEFFLWYNLTYYGPFINTIGIVVTAVYAITGAGISTVTPLPRDELTQEHQQRISHEQKQE